MPSSRSLGEIARHNSKDFDTLISNSHGGSLLGSRSNSRRGSFLGDHSGLRNGSITGSRLDDTAAMSEEFDPTLHTRKVGPVTVVGGGGGIISF